MSRRILTATVSAVAVAVALIPGATAGHATPAPTGHHITGVYSYFDAAQPPRGMRNVVVVFKLSAPLRNRSTSVDGGGQQSVAYRGARCFYMFAGTKGRKLGPKGVPANVGTKHRLTVTKAQGGDASRPVSFSASFKIRRQGSRAEANKQLGC